MWNSPKEIFHVPLGSITHQITKRVVENIQRTRPELLMPRRAILEVFAVVTKKGVSCLYDITCKENDSELKLRRQKRGVFHQIQKHGEQGWYSGESTHPPSMSPGFKSRLPRLLWVELVVVLSLALRGFSPGLRFCPQLKNQQIPIRSGTHGHI